MIRTTRLVPIAFKFLNCLTDQHVMNTVGQDKKPLGEKLVVYALDDTIGPIQQKTAFAKHCISQKFDQVEIYDSWSSETGISCVKSVLGVFMDLRMLNEVRTLRAYYEAHGHDIKMIQANGDSQVGDFHAQKQSNQDFWVTLKTKLTSLGQMSRPGYIPQDEKSGKGMFDSATRGTIGLLTYDNATGENVQIISQLYSKEDLIVHDLESIKSIEQGLKHDKLFTDNWAGLIKEATNILKENKGLPEKVHNQYQKFIWDHFQINPKYNRSTSFIFTTNVNYPSNATLSQKEVHKLLGDNLYNLDNRGECRKVSLAIIQAYHNTVDNKIIEKIRYLHSKGYIEFNRKFIEDFWIYAKRYGNLTIGLDT